MTENGGSKKTVYVLGAGCSRNYENQSEIKELKPPLDRDFFEMAARVLTHRNELTFLFERLMRQISTLYHFGGFGSRSDLKKWIEEPISLESTLTFLDLKAESEYGEAKEWCKIAREELLKLVRLTFDEALKGPPCELHRRLAKLVQISDSVLSYNYDILADNALFLDGKINESNYLIPFRTVHFQGRWRNTREPISRLKLLKLHGSLNWLFCECCSSLLCYLGEKTPEDYRSHYGSRIICPHCGYAEMKYVIIPPILHKSYDLPTMTYLWREAKHELMAADRVVVIGYSMPTSDFRSELLFRGALGGRRVSIDIVNPDEQVLDRFKSISQPISRLVTFSHYVSLKDFLDKHEK